MSTETVHDQETHQFQAEIAQLLDIVINSLYTHREVFIRELISNAADASEKFRHEALINQDLPDKDKALEVRIDVDKDANTFTITDAGIGMSREELSENLGTIAHSGTKAFVQRLKEAASKDVNLIGQFGVGFYSAFMVAKKVTVETRSFHADSQGWVWESEGTGSYTIAQKDGLERGTRITIELKDDAKEFAESSNIKDAIRRYSNFVPLPILVNDEKVNTIQPIWTRNRSEITDEEYTEFYKFIANAWDEPLYRLHFNADAPLAIRALLYVGKDNPERLGLGKMEPGADLYCRKVLIDKHPENLLPDWLRFARGVIDSDDLPLNISRETLQDSALIRKLSKVITGRFIKFLNEEAKNDEEKYNEFYATFGHFIKEGVAQDFAHRGDLAKLLRFESSALEAGKKTSLEEYVGRMKDEQKDIYFINGASRAAIEAGPYVEAFRERGIEVLYTFDQIDDYVFMQLGEYQEKKLVSADRGDIDLPELDNKEGEELSKDDSEELCGWLKTALGDQVGSVRVSKRLVNNPAVAVTEGMMSSAMQRLMMAVGKDEQTFDGKSMTLEINPRHALIHRLHSLKGENEDFAKELAAQLYDNALLAAGLFIDPRAMVERLNKLLTKAAGG